MIRNFCDLCGREIKSNTYWEGTYYLNGVPQGNRSYSDFLICQECIEVAKKPRPGGIHLDSFLSPDKVYTPEGQK